MVDRVERTKAGPLVEALNDPRLWIQVLVILFSIAAGWFSLRGQVEKTADQVAALDRRVSTVESRFDRVPERLATLEAESRATNQAVSRIERWTEPTAPR